jgi:hypothetical protein
LKARAGADERAPAEHPGRWSPEGGVELPT